MNIQHYSLSTVLCVPLKRCCGKIHHDVRKGSIMSLNERGIGLGRSDLF